MCVCVCVYVCDLFGLALRILMGGVLVLVVLVTFLVLKLLHMKFMCLYLCVCV